MSEKKDYIDKFLVGKDIYERNYMKEYNFFNDSDTIMVKASTGMGKTKNLYKLFDDYKDKKIVIVSFRRTLDREYIKKFEGFTLYEDIKTNSYDIDIYQKIVVQIDSFYKICGKIDLLVLDEITYTFTHLVERAKHKEAVYNTFLEYIRDLDNKIIIMDALLDIYTVKWFYHQRRKIYYMENKFKKHIDKTMYVYNNKIGIFVDKIIENLKNNKKIILPTNCKNFLNTLEFKIKSKLPNKKIKFLDVDNSDDINLENWNIYDIVGYTPTIVAGISYENFHFDSCFGYFINSSAPVEMALQQIFRVRNLTDNEVHICVENKDNNVYLTDVEDIENYIIDRNKCLIDGALGIKLSRINKTILKDSYFYLYLNVQIKIFKSKNDYENVLIDLLKQQGIVNIKKVDIKDENNDKEIRKEMRETSKTFKEELINDIVNADEIDDDEYYLFKNKTNLTYQDKIKMKKKKFRMDFHYINKITNEMYKKYNRKGNQFKLLNTCYTLKDDLISYLTNQIENVEYKKIEKNELMDKDQTQERYKLLTPNTFILHQSKKNEKFIIGLEIIKIIGADNIFNENKFSIDFNNLYNYIKEREYIIRLLFKNKKFDINMINIDDRGKNDMLKYINSRLRTLFNISIKKRDNDYIIDNMNFWNKDINPFQENQDLKNEMFIQTLINNMDIDI